MAGRMNVRRAQLRLGPLSILPSTVPFWSFFRDVPRKCTFSVSGFCRRDGRTQPRLVPLRSLPSAVPFWSFFRDIPRKCTFSVSGFCRRDGRTQSRLVPPRFLPSTVPFIPKVENFSKSPIVWLDARHILHCRESTSENSM
jgi:hypothetical protein